MKIRAKQQIKILARQCRYYHGLLDMSEKKTELMVCDICGVKAARVVKHPQVLGRGEPMMLVDNVPFIACKNCGESYMTSATMHKLDDIRRKQKEKTAGRKIAVAEFV